MDKRITWIIYLLIALCLASCENKEADQTFSTVEEIMTAQPDSALRLLESIQNPNELTRQQRANYILLLTQANDKNNLDLAKDTAIKESVEYFSIEKNNKKLGLAYFYQNRVYQAQKNYEKAILSCLEARKYAILTSNDNLLGFIHHDLGYMYKRQFNPEKSIENYKLSQEHFFKTGDLKFANYTYNFIASGYLIMVPPQIDSAIVNYRKSLLYAEQMQDSNQIADIHKNISLVYEEQKDYPKVKIELLKALKMSSDKKISTIILTNLVETYIHLQQSDSAMFYMDQLNEMMKDEDNLESRYNYHFLLYNLYKNSKKFDLALENYEIYKTYADSIYENNISQSLFRIQEEYEQESLKNEYNRVLIHRLYLSVTLLAASILCILIIYYLIRKTKTRTKDLLVAEHTMETLQRMLSFHEGQDTKLRRLLVERLDIARKVAKMQDKKTKNDKDFIKEYNRIFDRNLLDSLFDWNNIYSLINDIYNGFANKIGERFPELSEKEKRLICLLRAEFSADEISSLLLYEYDSVRVMKMKLRIKLGFDNNENFMTFLKKI